MPLCQAAMHGVAAANTLYSVRHDTLSDCTTVFQQHTIQRRAVCHASSAPPCWEHPGETLLGIGISGVWGTPVLSLQLFEQCFGLLQVGRVKALREPAVDRRQECARLGPLALLLPQAAQAHGGAQLQGFRLLLASNSEGLVKAAFCLLLLRYRLPQEQDAPEAVDFRFPPAFLMLLHQGMCLDQRLEAVCRVAQEGTDFRQHGAKVWDEQCCRGGSAGGDPLADLCHPLLALALQCQRPPT